MTRRGIRAGQERVGSPRNSRCHHDAASVGETRSAERVNGDGVSRGKPVEAAVQLQHVHVRRADEAEIATDRGLAHQAAHVRRGRHAALAATRSTWMAAYAGEMPGSRPDADAVTASAGTSAGSTPSNAATSARRCATSVASSGEFGSEVGASRRGPVVVRRGRPGLEVLRQRVARRVGEATGRSGRTRRPGRSRVTSEPSARPGRSGGRCR